MKILFWGTPGFAVPTLRALTEEGHDVVGVVTQPDRPAGRGRKLTPSPVKEAAGVDGLPVLTPERPRGDGFLSEIRALGADVSVAVAYGHILGREVLDVPPFGSLNVHASLLPALRGAAPIHWAVVRGHAKTGVTVMRMVEEMDAGPILLQEEEPIGPRETMTELAARLSEVGAVALIEALALLSVGASEEREQDHGHATWAPRVGRDTARIDWRRPAPEVGNLVRGMDEWPGAWSRLGGEPVKLFRPGGVTEAGSEEPGTILRADPTEGLVVATGEGGLVVEDVQPPGKRRMKAVDWIRGRAVAEGQRFE